MLTSSDDLIDPDTAHPVRVLPSEPYASLADYTHAGGGDGLTAALAVEPATIIDEIVASGLRGRGGAGFPTGTKWRTIRSYASALLHTTVVVNAAEGEPGTLKDRSILRANPYAVIEGALIAAWAVDARTVVIATKASFTDVVPRVRAAVEEIEAAGWTHGVEIRIVEGPGEYLYGEETALLEVIDGRPPFPRIAPPFRRGVVEVVKNESDADSGSGLAADVQMAGTDGTSAAPPVLVNNVETMANVPGIIARGAAWFRSVGTADSPGTIVCTVTGSVRRPGVVEIPMGTTLRAAIDHVGGGVLEGRTIAAVLVGVSSPPIGPDHLDTELTYDAMRAIGSGVGSAGFVVIGDDIDPLGLAAGVSRFLAIESCGQCTGCKVDGGRIAATLARLAAGTGQAADIGAVHRLLGTVADGARCSLAGQHQSVVGGLMAMFGGRIRSHLEPGSPPVGIALVTELVGIDGSGAIADEHYPAKRPDWTYDAVDSGRSPVDRFTDHRAG